MSFLLALFSAAPILANEVQPVPAQDKPAAVAPAVVEPKWTGSVTLGATYADGNTDRRTASAVVGAEYRREKDRTTVGLLWNYAEEKAGITDRKTQGRIKYDYFFTKKMYGLAQASGENDYAASLELRTTIGAGLGYQFEDTPTWKLAGELGLSYVNENFDGSVNDNEFLAGRAAYNWAYTPNDKYNVSQVAEVFPSLENGEDVNARVDTKGRMNLTAKMFASLEWVYQWDNTPPAGNSRNDSLVMLGLGWSF